MVSCNCKGNCAQSDLEMYKIHKSKKSFLDKKKCRRTIYLASEGKVRFGWALYIERTYYVLIRENMANFL